MNIPVFDLHCDTALELLGRKNGFPKDLKSNDLHIDLDRAAVLDGYCQCFACFTTPAMEKWGLGSPELVFERELSTIREQILSNSDRITLVTAPDQVEENRKAGKMSAILTIEGPAGFGFDPSRLQALYDMGFRITTLGWNEKNVLTGSHVTGGGLTESGREYVREAQRLGMLIDVSHISDEGFWDIIEVSHGPVIATHSNSRSVYSVSRSLTDDMFRAICATGGVAGFNLYASFVGDDPDLNSCAEHFLHWLELDPDGTHICLGGDLDGCDTLPKGFLGVQSYPALADCLLARGVSAEQIHNIFWYNAIGVMERAVCNHKK